MHTCMNGKSRSPRTAAAQISQCFGVCIRIEFLRLFTPYHTATVYQQQRQRWLYSANICIKYTTTHTFTHTQHISLVHFILCDIIIIITRAVEFFCAVCSISHNLTAVQSGASPCNIIIQNFKRVNFNRSLVRSFVLD